MANGDREPIGKSFGWYAWYKVDRTVAVLGIVGIALYAIFSNQMSEQAGQICSLAIGALATYIGGRSAQ